MNKECSNYPGFFVKRSQNDVKIFEIMLFYSRKRQVDSNISGIIDLDSAELFEFIFSDGNIRRGNKETVKCYIAILRVNSQLYFCRSFLQFTYSCLNNFP